MSLHSLISAWAVSCVCGYRVSPTEVEEVLFAVDDVIEAAAVVEEYNVHFAADWGLEHVDGSDRSSKATVGRRSTRPSTKPLRA